MYNELNARYEESEWLREGCAWCYMMEERRLYGRHEDVGINKERERRTGGKVLSSGTARWTWSGLPESGPR